MPKNSASLTLEFGRGYLDRGWSLLALRGKKPHHRVNKEIYGTAVLGELPESTTAADVEAWLGVDPHLNLGIRMGQASGGLVVIDVDIPIAKELLPRTPIVRTKRGVHVYTVANRSVKGTAVSGRGEVLSRGYSTAPPGTHPDTGQMYWWERSLQETPLIDFDHPSIERFLRDVLGEGEYLDYSSNTSSPSSQIHNWTKEGPSTLHTCTRGTYCDVHVDELTNCWDRHQDLVREFCASVPIPLRGTFRCVLPGHEERRPSASLYETRGQWVYHCFHHRSDDMRNGFLTLSSVFASIQTGHTRQRRGAKQAFWVVRLLERLGALVPVEVPELDLPPGLTSRAYVIYDGFLERCRLGGGAPVPFTHRFAERWCDLSDSPSTGRAINQLMEIGAMVLTGFEGKTRFFQPGEQLKARSTA